MFIKIYDEIPEEAKAIREEVFIKEQGFKDEFDEIDDVAKHVLIFDGDIPVGTCRFFFQKRGTAMLSVELRFAKNFVGSDMAKRCCRVQKKQLEILEAKW